MVEEQNRSAAQSESHEQLDDTIVIGIGSSAGGLEALQSFFSSVEPGNNFAYVVAQHLSPGYRSMLTELLSRSAALPIVVIVDDMEPEPGRIHVTPPNSDIIIEQGRLRLRPPSGGVVPKPSVDLFFSTLARYYKERCVGVILSGTGSDGAHGIRAIKAEGGMTFAQLPSSAKYDGMPQAAIRTGKVDRVAPAEQIARELPQLLSSSREAIVVDPPELFDSILQLILDQEGVDFRGYKRSTIERRLQRRIAACHCGSLEDYYGFVQSNPDEIHALFNDLLIGVTSFFRDEDAFAALRIELRRELQKKEPGSLFRVWVPGCSTGEEAWSVAILLRELLTEQSFHLELQIFATDIDSDAVAIARRGLYPEASILHLDPELVARWFRRRGSEFEIDKSLRESLIFSRHDLIGDPPFLRLDLLTLRNLLIYIDLETQRRILPMLHYALNPGGLLFLGKSEGIGNESELFEQLDRRFKLYRRKAGGRSASNRLFPVSARLLRRLSSPLTPSQGSLVTAAAAADASAATSAAATSRSLSAQLSLGELVPLAIGRLFLPNSIVVGDDGNLLYVRGNIAPYITIPQGEVSYYLYHVAHEMLRAELRTLLYRAGREDRLVTSRSIRIVDEESHEYIVRLLAVRMPIAYDQIPERYSRSILIAFLEESVRDLRTISGELLSTESESESATENAIIIDAEAAGVAAEVQRELERELAETREHLQTVIEELETTNEELQSLNEELQSSNEELQSSNEELETTNEELQSTNEELQTAYAELRVLYEEQQSQRDLLELSEQELRTKNEELEQTRQSIQNDRDFLHAIYDTADAHIVVLNAGLEVVLINRKCEESLGYDFEAVYGRKPYQIFTDPESSEALYFASRLDEAQQSADSVKYELAVRDRNGNSRLIHWTTRAIRATTVGDEGLHESRQGFLILIGLDATRRRDAEIRSSLLSSIVEQTADTVIVTDCEGRIEYVNPTFTRLTGYMPDEVIGKSPGLLSSGKHSPEFYRHMWDTIREGRPFRAIFVDLKKSGEEYYEEKTVAPIRNATGEIVKFVSTGRDISDRIEAERLVQEQEMLQRALETERHLKSILQISSAISEIIISANNHHEIFRESCEALERHVHYRRVWLGMVDEGVLYTSYRTHEGDELIPDPPLLPLAAEEGESTPALQAIRSNARVLIQDVAAAVHYSSRWREAAISQGYRSILALPLRELPDGEAFAVLVVMGSRQIGFESEEISLLEDLAGSLGHAYHMQMQKSELHLKEQMLIQQSRLAAMGEMISAIAHQWRQPLNIVAILIQDLTESFKSGEVDDQSIDKFHQTSMAHVRMMSRTIDDFRNFFKPSKEKVPFRVEESIEEMVHLIQDQFDASGVTVRLQPSEGLIAAIPAVVGYPNEFKHAILNILNNARDSILERRAESGGELRGLIELGVHHASKEGMVIIDIHDNGLGISSDVIDRIFEPYFTTKEDGTGIGMHMTRVIIETNMSGSIQADSGATGAHFRIELPAAVATAMVSAVNLGDE